MKTNFFALVYNTTLYLENCVAAYFPISHYKGVRRRRQQVSNHYFPILEFLRVRIFVTSRKKSTCFVATTAEPRQQ